MLPFAPGANSVRCRYQQLRRAMFNGVLSNRHQQRKRERISDVKASMEHQAVPAGATESARFSVLQIAFTCSISSASVTISDGRFKFCEKGRQVFCTSWLACSLSRLNHRFNGIERVKQKMRIHLRVQQRSLTASATPSAVHTARRDLRG